MPKKVTNWKTKSNWLIKKRTEKTKTEKNFYTSIMYKIKCSCKNNPKEMKTKKKKNTKKTNGIIPLTSRPK